VERISRRTHKFLFKALCLVLVLSLLTLSQIITPLISNNDQAIPLAAVPSPIIEPTSNEEALLALPFVTPSGVSNWCPTALLKAGAQTASSSWVWTNLEHQILNGTYSAHPHIETLNSTQLQDYTKWLDLLYTFYSPTRLRRSVMNTAPSKQITYLMKTVAEIKHHNAKKSENSKKRRLRVLALGGSVTIGINCQWPKNLNLATPRHWATLAERCAWPYFLEHLMNQVLFDGEEIALVENGANGGQSSEFGKLVLDYRLYEDPELVPDVILHAFSANDSGEPNPHIIREDVQQFVKAAQSLHPCNDHAPLLIMVDDLYGDIPFLANEHTGGIYKISTWHNVMAVDYGKTIKYKVLAEVKNSTAHVPLTYSNWQQHLGVGFHMGVAWTVMFNIVNAITNICNDAGLGVEHFPDSTADKKNDIISKNASQIDPELLSSLQTAEIPFQMFGYFKEGYGSAGQVQDDIRENMEEQKKICNQTAEHGSLPENPKAKCSYAWMVGRSSSMVSDTGALNRKMNEVIFDNDGWASEGFPIRQPRTGWYSHIPNSTFSIKVENIEVDTRFLIVMSMKSYSEKWIGSKLAVTTTVVKNSTVPDLDLNRTGKVNWDGDGEDIKFIDGYHDTRTSVHFVHKIELPDDGAKAGDSLILDAKLVRGSEFKIAGLAFCGF